MEAPNALADKSPASPFSVARLLDRATPVHVERALAQMLAWELDFERTLELLHALSYGVDYLDENELASICEKTLRSLLSEPGLGGG